MNLKSKIAVITGGNSGIGYACAKALAKEGVKVVIWDKTIDKANSENFFALACDVSSSSSVEEAMQETIKQVGIPAICISSAGIAPAKRMLGKAGVMPLENFKEVIDINLIGSFNIMRVLAASMLNLEIEAEERGVIINIASIAAFEGQIGQLAYSASKGGVVSMTLPAARELAMHSIRVNAIAPGLIETPLFTAMSSEVKANLAASVTFPKRLGHAEEVASLAIEIIKNSYINGEIIRLDGALRMQA